jgi:hypothetical protein
MFRKTGIAISTQTLSPEEANKVIEEHWEIGQAHPTIPDLVWDGEHWITKADWEARAVEE